MDLAGWEGMIWRRIFRTHIFCSFFAWHLMQTWVLHWVHTLSEKDKDLQEEIFKQLKHKYTHYKVN